jgi:hypothetical protein
MSIRWALVTILATGALAAAGVARADLLDPLSGDAAAGTTDTLAPDDEIVDSPAAFDAADDAAIADALAADPGARVTATTCLVRNRRSSERSSVRPGRSLRRRAAT